MKKALLISSLFLLASLFAPKQAFAQACDGNVYDTTTGDPINGVTVNIVVCISVSCDTITQSTNSLGYWRTIAVIFFGNIQSVQYSAPGYLTKTITQIGIGGCEVCSEASCQWVGGNPNSVSLEPTGPAPLGWDCINPTGMTPEQKCGTSPVPGGTWPTQNVCFNNCFVTLTPPPPSSNLTCSARGGAGINTAIGCIPVEDTNAFIGFILSWGIGIAGGIAFILILVAGFQITTSSGDPKRLQAGKELLTSAIAGLLLLIFSAFILRLIGVDILGLPEFGG